jgi:membrane-associated phospholipid phosphatase
MPVLVALSRVYRGEHHPTDILASVLFAALWLTATVLLIKPDAGGQVQALRSRATRSGSTRAEAATTARSA